MNEEIPHAPIKDTTGMTLEQIEEYIAELNAYSERMNAYSKRMQSESRQMRLEIRQQEKQIEAMKTQEFIFLKEERVHCCKNRCIGWKTGRVN